ncbi:MAG: 16S rRNA (cytosine(967)-C(5))-methyltransferase RsmB [Christensenellales bacterium]|jgi:16S rRNA (cytosine967-C5)-methyltransferase
MNMQRGPQKPRAGAREVARRALEDVVVNGAYAAQALDRQIKATHLLPDDRRLATSIFYAALENRIRISHLLKPFVKSALPGIYDVLHIACAQLLFLDKVPDHAAVDEAVKQARAIRGQQVAGFVNGVLRNVIRARDKGTLDLPDDADPSVAHSVAPELYEHLAKAYGAEEAARICAYRHAQHTQTVRPNFMTTTDEELGAYLSAHSIPWEKGVVPHAFLCKNPGSLVSLDGYRGGMFSLQGEGSMLAAYAVGAKPGMHLLDACAAPGGKSALLCERMNGTGRVYAWDVHEHRVELIRAASRRLKLHNLRPSVRDARTFYEPFDAYLDAVLIDAPCSGLGVMADKPDIRLRFQSAEVDALVKLQREILESCARYVKVNGVLVYATCTILPEENEQQVRAFLTHNPQFAPDTDDSWLPEKLRPHFKDGMVQLFQHRDGVEGFFIARMRRKFL